MVQRLIRAAEKTPEHEKAVWPHENHRTAGWHELGERDGLLPPHQHDELCRGKILDTSRHHYRRIIDDLAAQGAEAVILGCTEIGMLIKQAYTAVGLYDTTAIHADRAVEWALEF